MNTPLERLSDDYRDRIRRELLAEAPGNAHALRELADRRLREIIQSDRVALSAADIDRLVAAVIDDTLGFGPLDSLLTDPAVTEVIVNGCEAVYAERGGKLVRESVRFRDTAHLRDVIDRIVGAVGRRVDESSPMVDARLRDGSRVNAVLSPLAVDGPLLTIRRFPDRQLTLDRMVALGSLDADLAELLRSAVKARLNIAVCGGTGSGKTTFLNALAACIDPRERIVTVEDAAELRLPLPHIARLESRPPNLEGKGEVPLRALVRNALRMRPDRIIVGEVRGAEALDMLQAMNTGHDGSLTTVHAGSPEQALRRIEMMVLMAGLELPAFRGARARAHGDRRDRARCPRRCGPPVRRRCGRLRPGRWRHAGARLTVAVGVGGGAMLGRLTPAEAIGRVRSRRRARRIESQLPMVMQVLAAHVRAGRSLRQAIAESAADLPEPSAGQMRSAGVALDLGASPAQALELVGGGEDIRLMATATDLHARFGGDVAALFEGLAEALHERAALRRSAAVATAQARATGRLVSGMPLAGLGALWLLDRPALDALVRSPLGWAAMAVSAVLVLCGHVLIAKIASVDP